MRQSTGRSKYRPINYTTILRNYISINKSARRQSTTQSVNRGLNVSIENASTNQQIHATQNRRISQPLIGPRISSSLTESAAHREPAEELTNRPIDESTTQHCEFANFWIPRRHPPGRLARCDFTWPRYRGFHIYGRRCLIFANCAAVCSEIARHIREAPRKIGATRRVGVVQTENNRCHILGRQRWPLEGRESRNGEISRQHAPGRWFAETRRMGPDR